MKRRITIDLDIDLNGVSEDEIDWGLDNAVKHLAGDGWFTGMTGAEVDTWDYTVEDPDEKKMINTDLTKDIVASVECPIRYCGASVGEYCKTPNGNMCKDLHKRRYGKYVRHIGFTEFKKIYKALL